MEAIYDGLTVVELADRRNQFAGKLLADAGATVIQVEPLQGSAVRYGGPFVDDLPDPNACLDYWYYNAGKQSVALDATTTAGGKLVQQLVSHADVFLESARARDLREFGLDYSAVATGSSLGLIQASITNFGQDGPWCNHTTNAHAHLALGGQMASSGYSDPTVTPIGGQLHQAYHVAGVLAVQAVTVALIERLSSGEGQYIDCAIHDCCSICTENAVPAWVHGGDILYRHTGQHAAAQRQGQATLPCADGQWLNTITTEITDNHWTKLLQWMREEGVAEDLDDPQYLDPAFRAARWRRGNEIREGFKRLLAKVPSEAAMLRAQDCQLAWAVVRAPEENYEDAHWIERGFFAAMDYEGRTVRYPGGPFLVEDAPIRPRGPAPRLGQHTESVLNVFLGLEPAQLAALREDGVIR